MLKAPNLSLLEWLEHGFGGRESAYPAGIVTVRQIHSAIVVEPGDGQAEGDALVTAEPGALVGIRTADCVPVLIADDRTQAVAAIHAGWRGTAAGIVSRAVDELITRFGCAPQNLHAAIGPSIGPCCYEVSTELAHQFGNETRMLDLRAINARLLREAGVEDVWISDVCTKCDAAGYFSYRREQENAGRQISFIGRKKG